MTEKEIFEEAAAKSSSSDYKERFFAEYWQLKVRIQRLERILCDWNNLNFKPDTPKYILIEQADTMRKYSDILEARAEIEGIVLQDYMIKMLKE